MACMYSRFALRRPSLALLYADKKKRHPATRRTFSVPRSPDEKYSPQQSTIRKTAMNCSGGEYDALFSIINLTLRRKACSLRIGYRAPKDAKYLLPSQSSTIISARLLTCHRAWETRQTSRVRDLAHIGETHVSIYSWITSGGGS